MKLSEENAFVDRLLKDLCDSAYGYMSHNQVVMFERDLIIEIVLQKRMVDIMVTEGLVKKRSEHPSNYGIEVTRKGRSVNESGGWIVYLDRQAADENELKRMDAEKLEIDRQSALFSKRSSNAAWLACIISGVALIFTYLQFSGVADQKKEFLALQLAYKNQSAQIDSLSKSLSELSGQIRNRPVKNSQHKTE